MIYNIVKGLAKAGPFLYAFFCKRSGLLKFNHFVNALAKYDIFLAWVDKFGEQKYLIMDITKTDDGQFAHVSK